MGQVRVAVEIFNPSHRTIAVSVPNALVDTGATRTMIPRSLANELGLEIVGSQTVRTASGPESIDQSHALVVLNGKQSFNDVWISDLYPGVLIGVVTLEAMSLGVDPKNGRLIDVESLLL